MIALSERLVERIRAHARRTYPEECCGALLGRNDSSEARIESVEPLENSRPEERRRRFRIDPAEYCRVESAAEARGLALLGFYHSHPDHPAEPSEYDREHALPLFHYVVVAVSSGGAGEITSWTLSEDRKSFCREPVRSRDDGD